MPEATLKAQTRQGVYAGESMNSVAVADAVAGVDVVISEVVEIAVVDVENVVKDVVGVEVVAGVGRRVVTREAMFEVGSVVGGRSIMREATFGVGRSVGRRLVSRLAMFRFCDWKYRLVDLFASGLKLWKGFRQKGGISKRIRSLLGIGSNVNRRADVDGEKLRVGDEGSDHNTQSF